MKKIIDIQKEIEEMEKNNTVLIRQLETDAASHFETLMNHPKMKKTLLGMLRQAEDSKDLTRTSYGEFAQYVRVDFSDLIDPDSAFQRDLLRDYLSEHHYAVCDFENDVLMYPIGHCILINDDGDILDEDSGKWIVSRKDYESEEDCYALIEQYMEKSGYYPSVVICDRYGEPIRYVNTNNKETV